MKNCGDFAESISLYIDGQLGASEKARLEKHTEECGECNHALEELSRIVEEIKMLPQEELPEGFHKKLMDRINSADIKQKRVRAFDFGRYVAAAAGILLTLMVISGIGAGLSSITPLSSGASAPKIASYVMETAEDAGTGDAEFFYGEGSDLSMEQAENGEAVMPEVIKLPEPSFELSAEEDSSAGGLAAGKITEGEISEKNTIKSYNINLRVEDVDQVMSVINGFDGYNVSTYVSQYGLIRNGSISRRVNEDRYLQFVETLQTMGEVLSQYESEEIIENQILDTEARLRAKETEWERLFEMLNRASSMKVMIMVEERLSQVSNEIDNNKSILMDLNSRASMPVVNIELTSKQPLPTKEPEMYFSKRISRSFIGSLNSMINFMENLVVFISGTLIPLVILIGLFGGIALIVRTRRRR